MAKRNNQSVLSKEVIQLLRKNDGYLRIKAQPNAAETRFKEIFQDQTTTTVKLALKAAPEKGKANTELCKFLKKMCGATNCTIISGHTSPIKLVKIS